jgi:hypothetical protein
MHQIGKGKRNSCNSKKVFFVENCIGVSVYDGFKIRSMIKIYQRQDNKNVDILRGR